MKYVFAGIIVPGSALIPVAAAILRSHRLRAGHWYIFAYLCFSVFASIAARILASNGINNMPLLHIDTIIEALLFSFFLLTRCIVPGRVESSGSWRPCLQYSA